MNKDEIEAKLPLFINNKLDGTERDAVQKGIEENADLAQEFAFLQLLKENIHTQDVRPPGELGLARLKREILAQESQPKAQSTGPTHAPIKKQAFWKSVALAACCLLAVQSLFFASRDAPESIGIVPLSGQEQAVQGIQLQIVFKDTATAAQIRDAMLSVNATIIGGPGALGVYTINVPPAAEIENNLTRLQAYTFVQEVYRL